MADKVVSAEEQLETLNSDQLALRGKHEKGLYLWNITMTVLHLVQACACLAIGSTSASLKQFKLPLTTTFAVWTTGYPVPTLVTRGLIPFVQVTSAFSFLSAFFHLLVLIFWARYVSQIRRGINEFRWYEYSLSSSLMIFLISLLFGIYDIITLVNIFCINACMNYFGLLTEKMNPPNRTHTDFIAFWYGSFAGIVPWVSIFAYIGGVSSSSIPSFVWAILFVYLFFFLTFPINMYLQYYRVGWWADRYYPGSGYYFGERVYQVLSLFSKSLLLWLVVGGANQPNAYVVK
ncbi:hypothetical protein SmJEL517_g03954 [Synchytrium microbalum]|uniref:Uncharacterized protein n=1 Tax=Synchytrium microbalum TaxID=1806994 RepID=A0A507C6E7_9FUNG|nr:uncharacterized protein SmJEL517_g03954 [Synchytrium microbalum]TPX33123.1 hypothetical protein SmJEL517_g03954 [Synchytrium microbalum]